MEISPNLYRNRVALAEEHSDVLLAAVTGEVFLQDLLQWCFGDDVGDVASGAVASGPWSCHVSYQAAVYGEGRSIGGTGKVVERLDALVQAGRPTSSQWYPRQHDTVAVLVDAALASVVKVARRMQQARELKGAQLRFLIVTRRAGLAIAPLQQPEIMLITPARETGSIERLPTAWRISFNGAEAGAELGPHGMTLTALAAHDRAGKPGDRENAMRDYPTWWQTTGDKYGLAQTTDGWVVVVSCRRYVSTRRLPDTVQREAQRRLLETGADPASLVFRTFPQATEAQRVAIETEFVRITRGPNDAIDAETGRHVVIDWSTGDRY
jgi:hypothetical protein